MALPLAGLSTHTASSEGITTDMNDLERLQRRRTLIQHEQELAEIRMAEAATATTLAEAEQDSVAACADEQRAHAEVFNAIRRLAGGRSDVSITLEDARARDPALRAAHDRFPRAAEAHKQTFNRFERYLNNQRILERRRVELERLIGDARAALEQPAGVAVTA